MCQYIMWRDDLLIDRIQSVSTVPSLKPEFVNKHNTAPLVSNNPSRMAPVLICLFPTGVDRAKSVLSPVHSGQFIYLPHVTGGTLSSSKCLTAVQLTLVSGSECSVPSHQVKVPSCTTVTAHCCCPLGPGSTCHMVSRWCPCKVLL